MDEDEMRQIIREEVSATIIELVLAALNSDELKGFAEDAAAFLGDVAHQAERPRGMYEHMEADLNRWIDSINPFKVLRERGSR